MFNIISVWSVVGLILTILGLCKVDAQEKEGWTAKIETKRAVLFVFVSLFGQILFLRFIWELTKLLFTPW